MWWWQELMPTKDAEDSDGAPRAGTGQLKSWLGGLGKKPKDAETVKVWAQQILMLNFLLYTIPTKLQQQSCSPPASYQVFRPVSLRGCEQEQHSAARRWHPHG